MAYKILVAEDDPPHALLIKKILAGMNITDVVFAKDGMDAVTAMEDSETPFDLIISDMHMPRLTGLEFLERVKKDRRHYNVPFLILTGDESGEVAITAREMGATSYVVKPCTVEKFIEKVRAALLSRS